MGCEMIKRKLFICVNCDCVYADDPVSECDCAHGANKFVESNFEYSLLDIPEVLPHNDASLIGDQMSPEYLKRLRTKARLTQPQLADRIGYSERHIRNWEKGATEIPESATRFILSATQNV